MKQNKILLVMAAAAGLLILRKKNTSGVGATINPYVALSELQKKGVDFTTPWFDALDDQQKLTVRNYGITHGYKQPRASQKKQVYAESFYNSLKRVYAKAVSGVGGYNDVLLEDATEYPIYDGQGRVSLIYRDRNKFPMLDKLLSDIDYPIDNHTVRDANQAYWGTISYIAGGGKFIWSDKKNHGIKEELFGSRFDSKVERITRMKYLTRNRDEGTTITALAELWSANGGDFFEARDGIAQAVMDVPTVGAAKEMLYQAAISMLEDAKREKYVVEDDPFSDVPF